MRKNTVQNYVAVAIAEDWELAYDYKRLLEQNEIPVTLKSTRGVSLQSKTIIFVPDGFIEQAQHIINSQSHYGFISDFEPERDDDIDADEDEDTF